MTDEPISLDTHRGTGAQRATETRRRLKDVQQDQETLQQRQKEFEAFILAGRASSWPEAAAKAQYLIQLLADTFLVRDPRRCKLIDNIFEDFAHLSGEIVQPSEAPQSTS